MFSRASVLTPGGTLFAVFHQLVAQGPWLAPAPSAGPERSRPENAALREEAFSNVVITFRGLDEVGNKAFAEWLVEADHTGPLVLSEDSALEATGRHVQLPGVTVADFREGKIRSYRTYFDDISLIEQIVGA